MVAVRSVLIVGGGTAGCALAIGLAHAGIAVEIVEIKSDQSVRGSGITLMGNALRELRALGVWPEVEASGYGFDSAAFTSVSGELLFEITDAKIGGPDLPATLGMTRPRLAEILSSAAIAAGAAVRTGSTVSRLDDDGAGVDVQFADGDSARYDLVVGADGIHSVVRNLLDIDVEPRPTGVGLWRVQTPRPEGVTRIDTCSDGPCLIAGHTPTSADTLYAYLAEDLTDRSDLTSDELVATLRQLLDGYGGNWTAIRETITDPSKINYTSVESLLIRDQWHRRRVVLIGDAVHACPPTLAQGAAMCLEDAAVLTELLVGADQLDDALLEAFYTRRFDRVRTVVESSLQITEWMLAREVHSDMPQLIHKVNSVIAQPA